MSVGDRVVLGFGTLLLLAALVAPWLTMPWPAALGCNLVDFALLVLWLVCMEVDVRRRNR